MRNYNPVYDVMYERFKLNFPSAEENVITWWPSGCCEITAKLEDGSKVTYDDIRKTIRFVSSNTNPLDTSDEEWRKHFAHRLEDLMWRSRITGKELADKIGISVQMVSRYLNCRSVPSIDIVHKMARVFGCSIYELIEFPDIE